MLPIQLGNYLGKSDIDAACYRWYKPVIMAAAIAGLVVAVTVLLVSVCSYFYAIFFKPSQICSPEILASAKKLNDAVNKKIAFNKGLRPNGINVCKIIDNFVTSLVKGITLTGINIKPEEYVIRGFGQSVDAIHKYVEALDFGKDWHINLDLLENRNGVTFWTINVKYARTKK